MPSERLSKYLSNSGVASRRKCDEIIKQGRVKVNDIIVLEPFYRVLPNKDNVTVDNRTLNTNNKLQFTLLYISLSSICQILYLKKIVKLPGL